MNYDVIIVGAGPAGIFTAYELKKHKPDAEILLIEEGKRVDKRQCPKNKLNKCISCKPYCNITSGFSGAGAFSDGKLSLYNSEDDDIHVGGILHKYIGVPKTKELIDYADKIYLDFGADKKLEGTEYQEEIARISKRAEKDGIRLINIPIRHLGTEKSHEVYFKMEKYLENNNIEMLFETAVTDLIVEDGCIKGIKYKESKYIDDETKTETIAYSDKVVLAVGRKGANWLVDMCENHGINSETGIVDIGIRYELPDEIMKDVNKYMYEAKFTGRVGPFRDKVRTFCQNPSGFVSAEVYDNDLTLVNGHSYKERKSTNTNLAILVSHNFNHPFNRPIEYGRNVAGIVKKKDLYDWCTALILDVDCDVTGITLDKDGYTKGSGSDTILANNENETYNAGKDFIYGVYEGDEKDGQEAVDNALKELKKRAVPHFDYEVTTAMTYDEFMDVHIGDTVYIIDFGYNPILTLEARIGQLEISFTDRNSCKCTLVNYKEVKSRIQKTEVMETEDGTYTILLTNETIIVRCDENGNLLS